MSSFEEKLRQDLSADDEAFLRDLDNEEGLFKQVGATLTGPLGAWTIYAVIMSVVLFGVAIWAVFQMFAAEDLKHVILWLSLFTFTSLGVGLIKVWFWMRMNHLALMRELKRIEFRLVQDA